jgi:hypothetical protein
MGNETIHVVVEVTALIHDKGIAKRKIPEALRDFFRLRHRRAADQDRNDWEADLHRRFYFDPDRIVDGPDPQLSISARAKPSRSDDGEQSLGAQQGLADVLPEISSGGNIFDVPEYRVLSVVATKPVVNAPDDVAGVVAAIGNYDTCHRSDRRSRALSKIARPPLGCILAASGAFPSTRSGCGRPDSTVSRLAGMT